MNQNELPEDPTEEQAAEYVRDVMDRAKAGDVNAAAEVLDMVFGDDPFADDDESTDQI